MKLKITRKELMAKEYIKTHKGDANPHDAYLQGVEDTLRGLIRKENWSKGGVFEGITTEHPNDLVEIDQTNS